MRPQHLVPLQVRHLLVIGLVQGDPHLHIRSQLSVAEPGIVCKGFWDITAKQIVAQKENSKAELKISHFRHQDLDFLEFSSVELFT